MKKKALITKELIKTEINWMAEALKRLINFSVQKLKTIDNPEFADALVEFLYDDFFQYEAVRIYKFETEGARWQLAGRRGSEGEFSASRIAGISPDGNKVWTEGRVLFKLFLLQEEWYLLAVSLKDEAASYSMHECSFFPMLASLADSFYHMKTMSREMQEKVIEITNMRASGKIIDGLKENRMTLDEAILELHGLLSLDGVILAVPNEQDQFEVTVTRGSSITSWEEFVEFLQSPENQSEYLELFSLVDTRKHNYGILSCRLSDQSPELYALQLRVLGHITSQITLVLSEQRMIKEAMTDALTGLYNRRYVEDVARKRQNLFKTDPHFSLSVLMLDADRFKQVNDNYGHDVGDKVLRSIAGIIKHAVRNVDVVGRYGGEEFIILMHSDFEIAKKVAERIRQNVELARIDTGDGEINVTISIGIAEFTASDSHEQVVRRADENLYKAKDMGRNRVVF